MPEPNVDEKALHAVISRAFGSDVFRVERTEEGVSTPVYRIRRRGGVFYLRMSEEEGQSLGPEVEVHRRLRGLELRVPEVVFFEPFDPGLRRSIMITTEVPGSPLPRDAAPEIVREVLVEAGRELARVNQVPVAGFGWLLRDRHEGPLRAEFETYEALAFHGLEARLRLLADVLFSPQEIRDLERLVAEAVSDLGTAVPRLAHGDFDATHIFQQDGRFTGLIDFGEIRGAESWYDLAHFALHDGEHLCARGLADLEEGYADVVSLPEQLTERRRRSAVQIGVFRLGKQLERHGDDALRRPYLRAIRARVRELMG
jgi:aminoglycoside phosphotransferase (APT) family kinase protein